MLAFSQQGCSGWCAVPGLAVPADASHDLFLTSARPRCLSSSPPRPRNRRRVGGWGPPVAVLTGRQRRAEARRNQPLARLLRNTAQSGVLAGELGGCGQALAVSNLPAASLPYQQNVGGAAGSFLSITASRRISNPHNQVEKHRGGKSTYHRATDDWPHQRFALSRRQMPRPVLVPGRQRRRSPRTYQESANSTKSAWKKTSRDKGRGGP